MKRLFLLPFLLLATSCTAPENQYCDSFGLRQGDAEYQKCLGYYFEQQNAFNADRMVCDAQADVTYPPSLYSRPQSFPVRTYGYRDGFAHTEMVHVGTDYQQNAQIDALRMRIIEPCMQSRGWNSGATWTAGRHQLAPTGRRVSQMDPNGGGLPWLK